jgi:hypothetical protein
MSTSDAAVRPAVVAINYKGREEPLAYHAHEHVGGLVDDAIVRFSIDKSEKRLALFATQE